MRYEMTARENIGVGRIEVAHSDRKKSSMLRKRALPPSVIAKLPGGYDQMLGRRFEGGVDLSGGEWQKHGSGPRLSARCAAADSR